MDRPVTAIGIDLGNSNTRVSVFRRGRLETIPDDGASPMASCVAFTEAGHLVGAAAKRHGDRAPSEAVFDILRLYECGATMPQSRLQTQLLTFDLLLSAGETVASVRYKGEPRLISLEELLYSILSRAKQNAESYLATTVTEVVITVPTAFDTRRRNALRDIADLLGFQNTYLTTAPITAALAYAWHCGASGSEDAVLIMDFGSSSCDVAILRIEDGVVEVVTTASEPLLGGNDLDQQLINALMTQLVQKGHLAASEVPLFLASPRTKRRLHNACTRAKHEISSQQQTTIHGDSIINGSEFKVPLSRQSFEAMCQDSLHRVLELIQSALKDAELTPNHIQHVIALGGSSRIPYVQQQVSNLFNGKPLTRLPDLDESVASGAAILAAMRSGSEGKGLKGLLLLDATSRAIGCSTCDTMCVVVKRNTCLPTKKSEFFSTDEDNQQLLEVSILEGERQNPRENLLLGVISLPIPPAPRGVPQVEVTFDGGIHGINQVTACETSTGRKASINLREFGRLSVSKRVQIVTRANEYKLNAQMQADTDAHKNDLEIRTFGLKDKIRSSRLTPILSTQSMELVDAVIDWLDENPNATIGKIRMKLGELATLEAQIDRVLSGYD